METLAVAGHGGAVVVHSLAAVWHRVEAGRWDAWSLLHGALVVVSAGAIVVHMRRL